jgi:K+-sensing histidine kinase KdpD
METSVDDQLLKALLHLLLTEMRAPVTDLLSHLPEMRQRAEAKAYAELSQMSLFTLRYSERLLSVIDLFLSAMRDGVVKLITDRLVLYDVVEQARQALAARFAAQQVSLHNQVAPELPRIVLDERLFTQALIYLLESLLGANAAAGALHCWAEFEASPPHFHLRLHDTRPQTDLAALRRLFYAPMSALLSQRHSLPVILSRVVMRAHGGALQISRREQDGIMFDLFLPLMAVEPSVKALPAAQLFSDQPIEQPGDNL